MHIEKIEIKNFRILEDVCISLDNKATIIVGRNNSGKTSLTEVFFKFLGEDNSQFRFEDLSLRTHSDFVEANKLYSIYIAAMESKAKQEEVDEAENAYKTKLPHIEVNIYIKYEDDDDLSSLSKFIMDLDIDRKDALLSCQYKIENPEKFFKDYSSDSSKYKSLLDFTKKNFKKYYKEQIFAIDQQNRTNRFQIEKKADIESVFLTEFIYAQRSLDDHSADNRKRLSKGFEEFYRLNKELNEIDIQKIEEVLSSFSENLNEKYEALFKSIFNDLKNFGIEEGVNLQELTIKSLFESEKILRGNTQLFYQHESNLLPESYNGLGFSNLIFITLQFISFCEIYNKQIPKPCFQLIFIEEPEVHLHPQMQYVFIKNIEDFIQSKTGWKVQIVITTHSSHIVTDSRFDNIRYFDNSVTPLKCRDLSDFRIKQAADNIAFLKQYMSLNNCDMFFADKIIMVEGTVERLLLPLMIKKAHKNLMSKYISIIEVGGAYAHIFKDFLEFINVKTLVITDLDSVDIEGRKCRVDKGAKTSNSVLKNWLPKKESISELKQSTPEDKTSNRIRIAFQECEDGLEVCGRSFEEAFILKNACALSNNSTGVIISKLFKDKSANTIISESYEIAEEINDRKTSFAFDIMLLNQWSIPKYINEGLLWLEKK